MVKFSRYPAPLKWGAGLLGAGIALRLLYPVMHLAISGILYILLTIWAFFDALFHSRVDPFFVFTWIYVGIVAGLMFTAVWYPSHIAKSAVKISLLLIFITVLCNIGFYHQ